MTWKTMLAALTAIGSLAIGPSEDEARRRMDDMNRRAATRPTTARAIPKPQPKPVEIITLERYVARPDAPDWVVAWVEQMPATRVERIAESYEQQLGAMHRFEQAKNAVSTAGKRRVQRKQVGTNFDGSPKMGDDPADASRKRAEIKDAKDEQAAAAVAVNDAKTVVKAVQRGEAGLFLGRIRPFVGSFGSFSGTVQQIAGPDRMLVARGDTTYMLVGEKTAGFADDSPYPEGIFRVSGTHSYVTVMGASKTVFALERVDPTPHIQREPYEVTSDALDAELITIMAAVDAKRAKPPAGAIPLPRGRGRR